ncbi:MAG: NAD(P)H-hydrate dehydratase [Bacteroidaceae bacterium]|nr:NAD(P)H-hydrate dehydratase [Bacteroidaceae bacterium]
MKVLTSIQIKELDRFTIEHEPISSIDLMERAARQLTKAIVARWTARTPVKVFAGPGNNGGDALAVARLMSEMGYLIEAFLFNTGNNLSPDCIANRDRLKATSGVIFHEITNQFTPPELTENDLVVDGLFGVGLNKPLSGGFASLVKYINATPSEVVSIDLPSGLMCEDNEYNIRNHIVRATLTLTLQQPKLSFFFPEYQEFIGEYQVLDIGLHPQGVEKAKAAYFVTEDHEMQKMLRRRNLFAHKGEMGHGLLIAGSYGMAGASILAAKAALRSGLGKLTLHIPAKNNDILQISVPEAVLCHDGDEHKFTQPCNPDHYQAVAIGPGIGTNKETAMALVEQVRRTQVPLVLDADALNILGEHKGWIQQLPISAILTPHIKELDRIIGNCTESYERLNKARDLATRQHLYIILKGAWTAVIFPDGNIHFNPTGNPGMATAGSGDVLTGIILGLLCQGYTQAEACRLGVYLHGLAGDIAAEKLGEESLCAHDIVRYLPKAFIKIKS